MDLFLGRVTRSHDDIDVGIFRRDVLNARTTLSGWELFEAHAGSLTSLDPESRPGSASILCGADVGAKIRGRLN